MKNFFSDDEIDLLEKAALREKRRKDGVILTRRDHFAMAALTGMSVRSEWDASYYASRSYEIADAMEAERNKEGAE